MPKYKIERLVKKWTKILGLSEWKIIICYQPCQNESNFMEIWNNSDYKRCKLMVPPWIIGKGIQPPNFLMNFEDLTDEFIEQVVVHELLHIVVGPMSDIVQKDLDSYLHRDVLGQIEKAHHHAEERIVDDLAGALVKAYKEK